ncbi:Myb-DNA-bind-2 domain-containing protein [Mycena venus]|uniref:DNA-binding protein RAP1 n=1 Tax=Mycena venus TaxID=2733690 RepID=A0A8H6XCN7_9AGAR|nr:Myb-DNA-bind-2 domain-containing protein [Mycena venus]
MEDEEEVVVVDDKLFVEENGAPTRFFLHPSIKQAGARLALESKIEQYGGAISPTDAGSNVILVNPKQPSGDPDKIRRAYKTHSDPELHGVYVEAMAWVNNMVKTGRVMHHFIQKGMGGAIRGDRERTAFTEEDDYRLARYLAVLIPDKSDGGRLGTNVYRSLMENHETLPDEYYWVLNHTWQSWRERYKKNQGWFDERIAELAAQIKPAQHQKYELSRKATRILSSPPHSDGAQDVSTASKGKEKALPEDDDDDYHSDNSLFDGHPLSGLLLRLQIHLELPRNLKLSWNLLDGNSQLAVNEYPPRVLLIHDPPLRRDKLPARDLEPYVADINAVTRKNRPKGKKKALESLEEERRVEGERDNISQGTREPEGAAETQEVEDFLMAANEQSGASDGGNIIEDVDVDVDVDRMPPPRSTVRPALRQRQSPPRNRRQPDGSCASSPTGLLACAIGTRSPKRPGGTTAEQPGAGEFADLASPIPGHFFSLCAELSARRHFWRITSWQLCPSSSPLGRSFESAL